MSDDLDTETLAQAAPEPGGVGDANPTRTRRSRRSKRSAQSRSVKKGETADGSVPRRIQAEARVPYVNAYGNITKALNGIASASTPDRFTQDFLATKLGMKGGSPKPVIPFLKRIGFLNSDGTPTELYKRFRNPAEKGGALATAMRQGFRSLYEVNEYAHDLKPAELKGLVVQVTGLDPASSTVGGVVGSFNALKAGARFEADGAEAEQGPKKREDSQPGKPLNLGALNLGYTINLHLPATSDIAVFNAIFKSLKEHLLGE